MMLVLSMRRGISFVSGDSKLFQTIEVIVKTKKTFDCIETDIALNV